MEKSQFSKEGAALRAVLQRLRDKAGLTQRDLADRLLVPRSWVARVETGERRLDVVEFLWVCRELRVAPERALRLLRMEASTAARRTAARQSPTKK